MRAIIRFSLNGDAGGSLMAGLVGPLDGNGFTRTGTAKYENNAATAAQLRDALQGFWDVFTGYPGPASLDHFWMYVDD